MPGPTTTTEIPGVLPTEYITNARSTYEWGAVMKNAMDHITLPKGKGQTLQLPLWGQINAYQFTRGSSVEQNQQLSTSAVTISPISVAVHSLIDEYADLTASEDVNKRNGQLHGEAFVRFQERDLLLLLDGFSNSLGAAGTMKIGFLMAAYALIFGGAGGSVQGFEPPYLAVIGPNQHHAIAEDLAGLSSGALVGATSSVIGDARDEYLRKYIVKDLAGMKVMISGHINSTTGITKGGVFAKPGLVYVDFRSMRFEQQWDLKQQGYDTVTTAIYGRGERFDSAGIELNCAVTNPTA